MRDIFDYGPQELFAVHPCRKPPKKQTCPCPTCDTRRLLYAGKNLSVSQQERLRGGEILCFVEGTELSWSDVLKYRAVLVETNGTVSEDL